MSWVRKAAAAVGLAAGAAALLLPLLYNPLSGNTLFWRQLANFTHTPVFALLFLLLLGLSTVLGGSLLHPRWVHYLLAATVALAMALASEVFQYFGDRDADLLDLVRNFAGVAVGVLWTATIDRRLAQEIGILTTRRARLAFRSTSALLLLLVFVPVASTMWAYRVRATALPLLRGFDSIWERPFFDSRNVDVELTAAPAGWTRGRDDRVARLTFSQVSWPRIEFEECYPDWTAFTTLALDFYSESTRSHRLVLVVEDVEYAPAENRFSRIFDLAPGRTTLRIPLTEVRAGPAGRELDLKSVKRVRMFAVQPPEPFTIWIDDLRLEGAPASAD